MKIQGGIGALGSNGLRFTCGRTVSLVQSVSHISFRSLGSYGRLHFNMERVLYLISAIWYDLHTRYPTKAVVDVIFRVFLGWNAAKEIIESTSKKKTPSPCVITE
ncbi:hypothetical protein VTK73DRAFT_6618 [Phialemonium thermophilum]|uniref:Uncharacterized protein n=1 Tax=Phialemonium thermophilum TaxID=223376 RepID=A0ABR3XWC4_9PEZI